MKVALPPPVSVRFSQLAWILSFAIGVCAVVYLFVIRETQLPEIADMARAVDDSRADETYDTVADILVWSIFGGLVGVLLVQVTSLVSFGNRRPKARWWMFGSILVLALVFVLAQQIVAVGDRGVPLSQLLLIQLGLCTLGLLFSLLPGALRWTARQHDVRSGVDAGPVEF